MALFLFNFLDSLLNHIGMIVPTLLVFMSVLYSNRVSRHSLAKMQVYEDITEISNQRFCLFLRAFKEDHFFFGKNQIGPYELSPELAAFKELDAILPVLKVEDPAETAINPGVNKVYLDDNWKNHVLDLMSKASLILMKPATTEGVQWELKQIINNRYVNKTIFINKFGENDFRALEDYHRHQFFDYLEETYKIKADNRKRLPKYFKIEYNKVKYLWWDLNRNADVRKLSKAN